MVYTLITGASSGIGLSCAERFAWKGKDLILAARSTDKLKEIKSELLKKYSVDILVYTLDVSNDEKVDSMFEEFRKNNIQIDNCINNAGLALWVEEFTTVEWDDFKTMIDVNIKGFTKIAHSVLPLLKETDWYIFNISSVAWIDPYEGWHVYSSTKAYVKMLSKSLRIELFWTNVRVTDIAPWAVDTEGFSLTRYKWDDSKANEIYKWYTPLHAEDITDCIEFCYDRPKHVNIECMYVMPTAQASARRIYKK